MINVLCWNINQKGDITPPCIYEEIKKKIENKKADIIVLTEFYKTRNYTSAIVEPLQGDGYIVFLDPRPRKDNIRQVLIAIHDNFVRNQEIKLHILGDSEGGIYKVAGACPNYLRVDFSMNDVPLSIIGTRIRTAAPGGPNEHKLRQTQFDYLLTTLPTDREVIMVGDFNISDHELYKTKRVNWHYDENYKKSFIKLGMSVFVPENGNRPINSDFQLDHLVLNNEYNKSVKCSYYPRNKNDIIISR